MSVAKVIEVSASRQRSLPAGRAVQQGQGVNLASESVAGEEDPGASLDMAAAIVCSADSASAQPLGSMRPSCAK